MCQFLGGSFTNLPVREMALHGLLRWYALVLALFELMPLYLLLVKEAPLHSVAPYFAPHNTNADITMLFACFIACLLILRLAVFFSGRYVSGPLKWAFIAVHTVEAVTLGQRYLVNVYPRRQLMAFDTRLEVEVLMAFIVVNPLIFLFLRTPPRTRRAVD
jgi:hypothetical protein